MSSLCDLLWIVLYMLYVFFCVCVCIVYEWVVCTGGVCVGWYGYTKSELKVTQFSIPCKDAAA